MTALEERFLVYTALSVLCATSGAFLGPAAGVCSFLQILAVIELIYWFAFRTIGISPAAGE
jgi:hypothetical protein